jgi:hypothetical protein
MENQSIIRNISTHGKNKLPQIEIGKYLPNLFSPHTRNIELIINEKIFFTTLPDSFFINCKHLRTAYDGTSKKNQLVEWIQSNNIKSVKLEVVEKYKKIKIISL